MRSDVVDGNYDTYRSALSSVETAIGNNQTRLDEATSDFDKLMIQAQIDAQNSIRDNYLALIADAESELGRLNDKVAGFDDRQKEIDDLQKQYEAKIASYNEVYQSYMSDKITVETGYKDYETSKSQYDSAYSQYAAGLAQYKDGAAKKVFRIYMYISGVMAYDYVEAGDDAGGYQDGAIAVMRDGKGICEGFANTFVALCRAQGIPAVVEFGIGFASYDEVTSRTPANTDYADHAWAAVYLGDKWHFVDPTYDMSHFYEGPDKITRTRTQTEQKS